MKAPLFSRPPEALERYRCSACSYGISVLGRLPQRCPMCGGRSWLPERDGHPRRTL